MNEQEQENLIGRLEMIRDGRTMDASVFRQTLNTACNLIEDLTIALDEARRESERLRVAESIVREWCDVCTYAEQEVLKASIKRIYDRSCFWLSSLQRMRKRHD